MLSVRASNNCGTSSARSVSVTVNALPATPTISASGSTTFCAGGSVTLTSSIGSAYLWSTGATTRSIIVTSSGSYTVRVTNASGCQSAVSAARVVTVNPILTASVSISASANPVNAGTSVTFTATPTNGGTTPVYQWYRGSTPVGTNAATYTYVPVNGDVISVRMTSNATPCLAGSPATSNSITMTVNTSSASVSIFTTTGNTVCTGTSVMFTAVPVNGGSPTFQWYRNSVPVGTGSTYSYIPSNGDQVYVVMTSHPAVSGSPATSNIITMTVNTLPARPGNFTASTLNVCQGQANVVYTVPFVAGINYIWNYSGTGATITGTSNSVLVSFSTTATSGTLSVRASNNCGTSVSRYIGITVNRIASQPGNFTESTLSVCQGQTNVAYTVPNVAGVSYIWNYSGTGATIVGTSNSVLVSYSATATSGTLSVRASNDCGISVSRYIGITVNRTIQPGNFTEYTLSVCKGQSNVAYTVPYIAGVTYIWNYSGIGATIVGTSNSVLVSYSATATSGTLSVRTSNDCGISASRYLGITLNTCLLRADSTAAAEPVIMSIASVNTEVKVYPNPTAGPVTFEFQVGENSRVTLDITTMTGEQIGRIFDADVEAGNKQTLVYDKSLPPGMYVYYLRSNNHLLTGKFVKIR